MFDDFVDDDEPVVFTRQPRPTLLNLPHIEELIIETKATQLQDIRSAFTATVYPLPNVTLVVRP